MLLLCKSPLRDIVTGLVLRNSPPLTFLIKLLSLGSLSASLRPDVNLVKELPVLWMTLAALSWSCDWISSSSFSTKTSSSMLLEVARNVLSRSVGALALSLTFFSPPVLDEAGALADIPDGAGLASSLLSRFPRYLGGPLLDLRWRSLLEVGPSSPLNEPLPVGTKAELPLPSPLPLLFPVVWG